MRPAAFAPHLAPAGVDVKFVEFVKDRPFMPEGPRLILVHTNGAENEGRVESAWNWSHAKPGVNTCPHYQLDRSHDGAARCWKMLPTDRRGIGNATVAEHEDGHGDVSWFSIVIETADLGWPTANRPTAPGGAVGFDPEQGELLASIIAYEATLWRIPIKYPPGWFRAGVGCHTEPFGYPYWTLHKGKPCPGETKKRDMRNWILPRALQIAAAWAADEEEPMAPYLFKLADGGLGIRDGANGSRPLNNGEIEGPYAGETPWPVPAGSPWEYWIRRELAVYERTTKA